MAVIRKLPRLPYWRPPPVYFPPKRVRFLTRYLPSRNHLFLAGFPFLYTFHPMFPEL